MPELPEVETVRRVLDKDLIGLTITDCVIRHDNIVSDDTNEFKENVIGHKFIGTARLGKCLMFNLDNGTIIRHLRMEGKYFYIPKDSMDNKHIHAIFYLDNGYMLAYQDVRKFGKLCFRRPEELYNTEPLNNVGEDPILNLNIDIEALYKKIHSKHIPIKTTLLDQSILAGLGNIYVDEVLFITRIDPHRESNLVTINEVEKIVEESRKIFLKSIENKGTTIRSYTSSLGITGNYQNYLLVHTKEICPCCGRALEKCRIGGRGTYYCSSCQK